jgi:hypothetical protein
MFLLQASGGAFDAGFLVLIVGIVGIFLAAIVLLFLRKRTFPVINLIFIRLFHGKYSFQYLEFFKKNDLRNPLNNCIRDEITLHFSFFFKILSKAKFYQSNRNVEYEDFPFLYSYKQMVKKFGRPQCINIARFQSHKVKVVGYVDQYMKRKMKRLFFFIDDVFVMGEYVFSETHRVDPSSVRDALTEKYLGEKGLEDETFYIEGPYGNVINYHDNGFYASVKYFCRSDEQINNIIGSVFPEGSEGIKAFKHAMTQEELINRF